MNGEYRAWIWSGDETPHSGSGIRRAFIQPGPRKNQARIRGREDQQRPDVVDLETLERLIIREPDTGKPAAGRDLEPILGVAAYDAGTTEAWMCDQGIDEAELDKYQELEAEILDRSARNAEEARQWNLRLGYGE